MKKFKKWGKRILVGILCLFLLVLIIGFLYEQVARSRTTAKFHPAGELVDVGDHQLHILSKGVGSPTVVFESGLDAAGSLSWSAVHDSIAQFTQAVAYDRAGILWSERGEGPKTGAQIGQELYTLLKKSGHEGPYILVGHSLAGIIMRPFLDAHREEVAGLVLVDASHPEQLDRFPEEANKMMKAPPAGLIKLASNFGFIRLFMGSMRLPATSPTDSCNIIGTARLPISIRGVMDEMSQLKILAEEGQQYGQLDSLPLVVLTASNPDRYKSFPDTTIGKQVNKVWQELQKDHLNLSTHSKQVMAEKSFHYIQFEQPELVIAAIRRLVEEARR